MTVRATATLRPAATGWRSGFDAQQHAPADARTAVCGEQVRDRRWDRPDWPRCLECVATAGIVVDGPTLSESEQRALWGDR